MEHLSHNHTAPLWRRLRWGNLALAAALVAALALALFGPVPSPVPGPARLDRTPLLRPARTVPAPSLLPAPQLAPRQRRKPGSKRHRDTRKRQHRATRRANVAPPLAMPRVALPTPPPPASGTAELEPGG